ncbi:IS3 family transposase [Chitinivibrio alkaliphilus]|uniref:Integrase n=1 Tax=Chitinivibrio alkaliphilus ACht1 TaxID=1313304 RepID=U7D451_9BACT|nr:IS3 family transposase [Chitinivibrio alkaliphilus]ERP30738.1 Integrase [Chitinivibrio alkaliphilus ACht1]
MKEEFIDPKSSFSVNKQCTLLEFPRSRYYYKPRGMSDGDLAIMKLIDMYYTINPTMGTRRLSQEIRQTHGIQVGRAKIRTLMKVMNIEALYPQKHTTVADKGHKKYPYLLRGVEITHVDQVWSTDISYIPMEHGFAYLTAVIDWYSRKILSWRISNTMDTSFCIEVVEEALNKYGKPEIFNTDQGSQYTSNEFTSLLKQKGIKISMDGKGRALDNVYIERFWRTIKQENIYINEYDSLIKLRNDVKEFCDYYNTQRRHSSLEYQYPEDIYWKKKTTKKVS